jgi:HAD superfamily hydrolase (TIGR01509 family)
VKIWFRLMANSPADRFDIIYSMVPIILSDFSRVILFPKDKEYKGTLNGLYKELQEKNIPYNFFDYFEFNESILDLYTQLKKRTSVNIFTSGSIQDAKEVRQRIDTVFDNVYSAEVYGIKKREPNAYRFIAEKLQKPLNQILFIDDEAGNVEAARNAGLQTLHYQKYQILYNQLKSFLD